jgi:hypothetical protein
LLRRASTLKFLKNRNKGSIDEGMDKVFEEHLVDTEDSLNIKHIKQQKTVGLKKKPKKLDIIGEMDSNMEESVAVQFGGIFKKETISIPMSEHDHEEIKEEPHDGQYTEYNLVDDASEYEMTKDYDLKSPINALNDSES